MLRWWETDEDYRDVHKDREEDVKELREQLYLAESLSGEGPLREHTFQVSADTVVGETVCVTGGSYSLGNWNSDRVLPLKQEDGGNIWSNVARVPANKDIEFRYCICIILEADPVIHTSRHVIVRRWETNVNPRKLSANAKSINSNTSEVDTFGYYDNCERVERGWLNSETAVQIKLSNNPIELWKQKLQTKPIYVKLTAVHLAKANAAQDVNSGALEETISIESLDITDKRATWPVVEVAVMNEADREFQLQEQFGRVVKENDFVIFQILMHNSESIAYLLDFYTYGSKATENEPPLHIGFSYILPSVMKTSEGQTVAPITGVKHKPIGQITVEYLVVKPLPNVKCDMKTSLQRQWKETWHGLEVGHRGSGSSFKGEIKQCADVRENTIASLRAAASNGADLLEFDVQLSKDLIPVLYHDFFVCISMNKKNSGAGDPDMLQLPVKDLTLEQLHLLKIYHLEEGRSKHARFFDEDLEDHQPFPTLQQALEVLDPTVGFNVEIKWTMQLKDGTYELYHPFDLNMYLDIIIEVVLKHANSRNIVFSCFHPDICSMIRLKQNKYPVIFLTQGITDKYPPYNDQRCQTVPMAVHFAVSLDILGINAHTEDLLRDSSQVNLVKQAGLVLFCWGDDNNEPDTIKHLKELGLHAIIYDKIDKFTSKEVKESIFRIEARESERVMFRAVAEKAEREKVEHMEGSLSQAKELNNLNTGASNNVASPSTAFSMCSRPNGTNNDSKQSSVTMGAQPHVAGSNIRNAS